MADLAAFEAEVRTKIKQLASKDANIRLKAAQWLGEAGEPSAITSLAQTYKNDPDARVREAARYSLGMFRALEAALDSSKETETLELLQKVALEGKMGRRVPIRTRTLVRIEIVLFLLGVALIVGRFVALPMLKNGGQTQPPPATAEVVEDKDRLTLLVEVREQYARLRDDANTLQAQYQNLAGGTELSCQVFFNNPTPYSLSPRNGQDFPQINALAQQLNSNLTDLIIAKTPYNDFCNTRASVDPANLTGTTGTLERVISQLAEINTTLTALENEPTATPPPTETLIPTPAQETATPEIAPTATLNARPHLQELQRIIDDVTASTGANSLLKIYWEDAQRAGQTDGCVTPPPVIPEDYFLSPADAAQNPSLAQAVSAVNLGLGNVRSGWTVFKQACDSGNPGLSAQSGLGLVQTANDAFNAALALFPTVMQGG